MKTYRKKTLALIGLMVIGFVSNGYAQSDKTDAAKTIPVTAKNFAQAESALNFAKWAKLGSDKKLFHYRKLAPVGPSAPTVRMNWDTLYSCRIVKVSDDHTFEIQLPKTDTYISAHVIDENGFAPYFIVEKGAKHTVKIGTDYAWVLFRTEVANRKSKKSLKQAHKVQDGIQISGMMKDGAYVMPNYDPASLKKLHDAYTKEFLASGKDFTYAAKAGEVDQHILNLSHAAGWGGMPAVLDKSNTYSNSKTMSGDVPRSITFKDPKNKFFTSFTLYDADSYLMAGETHIMSTTWKPNPDGTITLNFNAGKDAINSLSSGGKPFNYTIRNYGVSQTVLDGKFKPVDPKPVK
ncbi:MAG: DUF1254 domain-containing protein [Xanthomonadales bacterium]|nr:DUF1254 domain-containing protein [Xanthomonadales bacterium]